MATARRRRVGRRRTRIVAPERVWKRPDVDAERVDRPTPHRRRGDVQDKQQAVHRRRGRGRKNRRRRRRVPKDPLRVSRAGRSRRVSTIPALRRVGRRHRRGRRGLKYLGDHA